MEAAAVRSAAAQLKLLLSETQAQTAVLATPYDAWEERLRKLKSPEDLISALRDIEQELNVLGDGLPRGEHPSASFINNKQNSVLPRHRPVRTHAASARGAAEAVCSLSS